VTGPDLIRLAVFALAQHRRRTALSLLGVSIGIIAVITLTALGEGARTYVEDQFAALGSNLLIVMPGKNETTGGFPGAGGAPNDLTLDDALAVARNVPGIERIVPMSMSTANVSRRERSRQVMVIGSTADFRRIRDLHITRGRFLPEADLDRGAPVAVLGRKLARELFGQENPVGQAIRVGSWRMRVIGVLAARGTQMGLNIDDTLVVPVATGLRMANRQSLSRILLELKPQSDAELAKQRVIDLMIERHDEEDITCLTQDAVMSSLSGILRVLTSVVVGIAAISLSVAGIGIMNVMLVSVSERTPEVGLLKALGATRRQILALFLVESVLLSTAGGVVGLAVGWLLVEVVVTLYPVIPASPPIWAVASVLGVSLLTGTVFGVLPAWRAARLDPVEALAAR
jgi:putative ABC transport system permease protein